MTTLVPVETDLWESFAASASPEVREQIVMQSVPLVHFILGRMGVSRENGMDYEDLVHQGLLGLIDAVDRYDPGMGNQFSTYAAIRIRGKVLDYLRSNDWMSRAARRNVRVVQAAISKFWSEQHREPTDEELAARVDLDLEEVRQSLVDSSRQLISLDMLVSDNQEDHVELHETHADENQPDPFELTLDSDNKARLVQAIKNLPEREQLVLSLYYFEELTFSQIGKVLQVSESRVCQLHSRAILNLKASLSNE